MHKGESGSVERPVWESRERVDRQRVLPERLKLGFQEGPEEWVLKLRGALEGALL